MLKGSSRRALIGTREQSDKINLNN